MTARRFELHRDTDVNGISGPGVVVEGVVFTDGRAAYRWCTATATTTVADSIDDVLTVHGHGGLTRLVWLDPPSAATTGMHPCIVQFQGDAITPVRKNLFQHLVRCRCHMPAWKVWRRGDQPIPCPVTGVVLTDAILAEAR